MSQWRWRHPIALLHTINFIHNYFAVALHVDCSDVHLAPAVVLQVLHFLTVVLIFERLLLG